MFLIPIGEIKRKRKIALLSILGLSIIFLFASFPLLFIKMLYAGKCIASSGTLLTLSGLISLDIAGLFTRAMDEYEDDQKYPFGPPSFMTREIINSPDQPIRYSIRDYLFFNLETGFYMISIGTILQTIAIWL